MNKVGCGEDGEGLTKPEPFRSCIVELSVSEIGDVEIWSAPEEESRVAGDTRPARRTSLPAKLSDCILE